MFIAYRSEIYGFRYDRKCAGSGQKVKPLHLKTHIFCLGPYVSETLRPVSMIFGTLQRRICLIKMRHHIYRNGAAHHLAKVNNSGFASNNECQGKL